MVGCSHNRQFLKQVGDEAPLVCRDIAVTVELFQIMGF